MRAAPSTVLSQAAAAFQPVDDKKNSCWNSCITEKEKIQLPHQPVDNKQPAASQLIDNKNNSCIPAAPCSLGF
jgi:hypothetical protein